MAKRKFTWIDIAVVLVLIISIAGIAYKFSKANIAAPTATKEKILITFYLEYAPDNVIQGINVGDPVTDSEQGSNFGKVTDITTGQSIFWDSREDGHLVASSREGFSSLYLTMETEGVINKNGISIDKSTYYIGQTISLYAGKSSLSKGRISKVEKVQ